MEASGDHLINSRKHAEDADVIRTIATRILESTADLLAQLWSTFGIVDQCIAEPREYMDLLSLSENRSNSACILLPSLRSRCRSSFADTTEYEYEPAHTGGLPVSVDLDADLLRATGSEHGARHFAARIHREGDARAERLSAHNPLFENGFRVPGLARSQSDSPCRRLLQRALRRRHWVRSDGSNSINSRTIEILIGRISPLRMTGSTSVHRE
jgi:hypothetical protein